MYPELFSLLSIFMEKNKKEKNTKYFKHRHHDSLQTQKQLSKRTRRSCNFTGEKNAHFERETEGGGH